MKWAMYKHIDKAEHPRPIPELRRGVKKESSSQRESSNQAMKAFAVTDHLSDSLRDTSLSPNGQPHDVSTFLIVLLFGTCLALTIGLLYPSRIHFAPDRYLLIWPSVTGLLAMVSGAWLFERLLGSVIRKTLFVSTQKSLTIIGWVWLALLSAVLGAISSIVICMHFAIAEPHSEALLICMAVLSFVGSSIMVFALGTFLARVFCDSGWERTRPTRAGVAAFLSVLVVSLLGFLINDDPVPSQDYTLGDLPYPSASSEKVSKLLFEYMHLTAAQVPAPISLSKDVHQYPTYDLCDNALKHSDEIRKNWQRICVVRELIEKLDGYATLDRCVDPKAGDPLVSCASHQNVARAYWAYSALLSQEGNLEEAARQLVGFHSVATKVTRSEWVLWQKILFANLASANIEHAWRYILANSNSSKEALLILRAGFVPIAHEDVVLRNALVWDYLRMKYLAEHPSFLSEAHECGTLIGRVITFLGFNKNRTLHYYREGYDVLVSQSVLKPHERNTRILATARRRTPDRPVVKNLLGYALLSDISPVLPLENSMAMLDELKTQSDLFFLELQRRLGEDVELPDYLSGAPFYQFDEENQRYFSAGVDGISGSEDDLWLGKRD